MDFLLKISSKLWGKSEKLSKSIPRSVRIFYKKNLILISSYWMDSYGRGGFGKFAILLPIDSGHSEIGDAVLTAMKDSRTGLDSQYDCELPEIYRNNKTAFTLVGSQGWDELDKKWGLVVVAENLDKFEITLTRQSPRGGHYNIDGDHSFVVDPIPVIIGEHIHRLI